MSETVEFNQPSVFHDIPVVDVDTHLTEPADLWLSRAPARLRERVPQVKEHDGALSWVIDRDRYMGPAFSSSAVRRDGSKAPGAEFLSLPFEDLTHAAYDPKARIAFMDQAGITAQLVYPNVLGFGGHKAMVADPEIRLLSTQIYNDAMMEIQAESDGRLFAMALMPWWDVDEAVRELERCQQMGLRGINTNPDPHSHGLPELGDPHWHPLWEKCVEYDLPINFHIGASDESQSWFSAGCWPSHDADKQIAYGATAVAISNFRVLANILLSGFLDRFPTLKIVSVESGVGWIPFFLECLEYQMAECAVKLKSTPKEVFQRQIYACSWFERENIVASARALGVDNVLFETDFPHPTCLYPDALTYIADGAAGFTTEERRKIYGGNAIRVYNLPL